MNRLRVVLFVVGLSLIGCTFDAGRFPILSTKNVEVSRIDLKKVPYKRDVKGTDSCFWFLFFPIPPVPLSWQKACDDCLANGNGDFMTSCRFEHFVWSAIIVSWESYHVIGDVGDSVGAGSREVIPDAPLRADSPYAPALRAAPAAAPPVVAPTPAPPPPVAPTPVAATAVSSVLVVRDDSSETLASTLGTRLEIEPSNGYFDFLRKEIPDENYRVTVKIESYVKGSQVWFGGMTIAVEDVFRRRSLPARRIPVDEAERPLRKKESGALHMKTLADALHLDHDALKRRVVEALREQLAAIEEVR